MAALLTVEGKLRAALAAGTGAAIINAHGYALGFLENAARGLATVTAATLFAGRAMARRAGRERMLQELGLGPGDVGTNAAEEYDRKRADRTAEAFAAYWLLKAKTFAADNDNVRLAARQATKASEWRLDMDATTEASTAYSGERAAVGRMAAPLFSGVMLAPFRVWCSARERNTCDACYGAHGEMVPLGEPFSLGEPGDVHPRCLCWCDIAWEVVSDADRWAA